jgi:hypothetical protein
VWPGRFPPWYCFQQRCSLNLDALDTVGRQVPKFFIVNGVRSVDFESETAPNVRDTAGGQDHSALVLADRILRGLRHREPSLLAAFFALAEENGCRDEASAPVLEDSGGQVLREVMFARLEAASKPSVSKMGPSNEKAFPLTLRSPDDASFAGYAQVRRAAYAFVRQNVFSA